MPSLNRRERETDSLQSHNGHPNIRRENRTASTYRQAGLQTLLKDTPQSSKNSPRRIEASKWAFWGMIGIYIIIWAIHGFYLFDNLILNAYDFGIYDHMMWRLAYDFSPANSVNGFGNSFGAHFQPLAMIIAPFYWLWNSPKMLILAEILIIASGAMPIYWIAKKKFKDNFISLALVFGYLFFIGNGATLAFPFHPSTMIAPVMLWAYYFFSERKWRWHIIFIILALFVKENAGLYVAGFGLLLLLVERKYWKLGLGYIVVSLGWVMVETKWLLPMLSGRKYHYFYYGDLGSGSVEALETIVKNPIYTLKVLLGSSTKVNSVLSILAGTGFLALITPYSILLLPNAAERFLSVKDTMNSLNGHYGAPMAFGFIVATIMAAKRLTDNPQLTTANKKVLIKIIAWVVIFGTIAVNVKYKPLLDSWPAGRVKPYAERATLQEGLKLIPKEASVTAQTPVAVYLAHRKEIFVYPVAKDSVEYIVLTLDGQKGYMNVKKYPQIIKDLLDSKDMGLIYSKGGVMVWERDVKDMVGVSERVKEYLEMSNVK